MRLQVKALWVGAPTQNITANGTFWNQDVVARDYNSSDTFVLRVTSGQRANNIKEFHILKDDVFECDGEFVTTFGKEGRPFMQFNCTAINRDQSTWGTTCGNNRNIDFTNIPASFTGYGGTSQPQQTPIPQLQIPQPTTQQPVQPVQTVVDNGNLPF